MFNDIWLTIEVMMMVVMDRVLMEVEVVGFHVLLMELNRFINLCLSLDILDCQLGSKLLLFLQSFLPGFTNITIILNFIYSSYRLPSLIGSNHIRCICDMVEIVAKMLELAIKGIELRNLGLKLPQYWFFSSDDIYLFLNVWNFTWSIIFFLFLYEALSDLSIRFL
jgi:hypothetical protein